MTKPTIPEVLPRLRAYRAKHGEAGALHVVVDDGNTQDAFVRGAIETARERGDVEGAELAETLLQMSRTQRRKLNALSWRMPRAGG